MEGDKIQYFVTYTITATHLLLTLHPPNLLTTHLLIVIPRLCNLASEHTLSKSFCITIISCNIGTQVLRGKLGYKLKLSAKAF